MDTRALRRALLAWWDRGRRDLSWRRTRDPYPVWVAEVMLQQTRVATVEGYHGRFLRRFPDLRALAAAPAEAVLAAWSGLGYYRRARSLHAAARAVVGRHGGRVPATVEALRALPGVGRYTAGAIASIAFGRRAPALDGNAARVLARVAAHGGDPDDLWPLAARLVPQDRPGDFNQALMELGATLCTPRDPRCPDCPLARACRAYREGLTALLPRPRPRAAQRPVRQVAALVRRRGRLLLVRRPPDGLFGGLWDLPAFDLRAGDDPEAVAARALGAEHRLTVRPRGACPAVRHDLTHLRMTVVPVRFDALGGRAAAGRHRAVRWIGRSAIAGAALSTLARKLIAAGDGVSPAS